MPRKPTQPIILPTRGIDDVEATLNQPLHDCLGDTFIREESRHALLTQL